MKALNTLTVQDMMWVNMQVCKGQQPWNFATLEEATFNQYSYGESVDLVGQAARFLLGFDKMRPFTRGNEATAFIGLMGYLAMNGRDLHVSDAEGAAWVTDALSGGALDGVRAKLELLIEEHDMHLHHGVPDVREILEQVMARYPLTISELARTGHKAALV